MNEKIITIFGSARPSPSDDEYRMAETAGRIFAEKGYAVATGGYGGIMEAASKGASSRSGKVYGITVSSFSRSPNDYVDENIVCSTLFERLEKLLSRGDGYLLFRGGTGTFLELAAVWEFINKGLLPAKPVVCCGTFWNSVIEHIDRQLTLEKRMTGRVRSFDQVTDCTGFLISELEQD